MDENKTNALCYYFFVKRKRNERGHDYLLTSKHAFMDETMTMALCYYIIMSTKKTCESLALFNDEHAFMDENMRSHNLLLPTSENKNK